MIKTLITNFTTLRKAEFIIDGLTVLRANSNGGKSSTVNAIFAGVTAEFPPSALRWGESQSIIQLQFPDGQIQLTRTGGSSSYKIDAPTLKQAYSKFGRKLPDEVVAFLNLCSLQMGDEVLCLNFHQQFAKPLSLAMSHNKFVSLLSSSDLLEEHKGISKKLSTRAYELQGSIDSFSSLVSNTQTALDAKSLLYRELLPISSLLDAKYKEIEQTSNALEAVTALAGKLAELQAKKNHAAFLKDLLSNVTSLLQKQTERDDLRNRVVSLEDTRLSVLGLEGKKKFIELWFKPALDTISKLVLLSEEVMSLRIKREAVLNIKTSTLTVSGLSQKLEARQVQADLISKVITVFDKKQELSVRLQGLSNLRTSTSNLASISKDRDNKKLIIDNNLCPLCLAPLGSHKH